MLDNTRILIVYKYSIYGIYYVNQTNSNFDLKLNNYLIGFANWF